MISIDFNNYVLISAAVKEELEFLKSMLDNTREYQSTRFNAVSGIINKRQILLVATNPGIVNTASALTSVVENQKPDLIIQTGCAGAFKKSGLKNGDIAVASCEIDIHTGIENQIKNIEHPVELLPFPLITGTTVTNRFPTDRILSEKAVEIVSASIKGKSLYDPFITVSTITATEQRENELYDAYNPCLESMEGSASAHIALLYSIPFLEIRAASNMVGERNKKLWDLPLAFRQSNLAVLEFIKNTGEL